MFLLVNGQAEITEPEGNENFVTDVSDEVSEMLEKIPHRNRSQVQVSL